ncbi:hypothetical protein PMAYCL1PPCAC_22859, partial [Pristionchus mayeri]
RPKTVRARPSVKEDWDFESDYATYGHLLYPEWRSRVCELLAQKSDDPWAKAMYLSECVDVSTRQAQRLRDGKISSGVQSVDAFKAAVSKIPSDMTVSQLIVTMSGDIYLLRVHSGADPIVVPLAKENKWDVIMKGFARAVAYNDEAIREKRDANKYFEGRRKAEQLMKRAMMDMESDLLGPFAPLLLPSRTLTQKGDEVVKCAWRRGIREGLLRELISIAALITYEQFKPLVLCISLLEKWTKTQEATVLGCMKKASNDEKATWIQPIEHLPFVFFVFSTELARAPWEAVSILNEKAHCSRLTAVHQLFSHLGSTNEIPQSRNPLSTYYVLDPANNLAETQNRLAPVVEKVSSWKGVKGRAPGNEQMEAVMAENDFFIYLGHGDGSRYLSRTRIRQSRCKSAVFLMGCDSAHTVHEGRGMDGRGAVLDFSVAFCPCFVGCLHTVTDNEIDKYFTALVEEGLAKHLNDVPVSTPASDLRHHLEAMSKARAVVKLPYLTGAAVVSYGIPIDFRVQ